jgi:DNA repair exonuclease SbcCD ATPase subunit
MAKCDEELEKINKMKEEYEEWTKRKKEQKRLTEQLSKSGKAVELYEYLVAEFSPKGIKERVLKKVVGPIESHCNNVFALLTDGAYKLSFNFDDDFDILVENGSGKVSYMDLCQ